VAERQRQSGDGRVADQRRQLCGSAAEAAPLAGWQRQSGSGSFVETRHCQQRGGGNGGWGGVIVYLN
jgi:hypothetical protein